MKYVYTEVKENVHRLVPSKFPPISLFDWAETREELEQIALLEGLTNERLLSEIGCINLVAKEDWVSGNGATPLMGCFTHIGHASRFSDGSFGVYYAANTLQAAIKETVFHRERFYQASNEPACAISMREYQAKVTKPVIDIRAREYLPLLNPDPNRYKKSQAFGKQVQAGKEWGLVYPSTREPSAECVAIFRPPALTIPTQGCHLKYIWDGSHIVEIYKESKIRNWVF